MLKIVQVIPSKMKQIADAECGVGTEYDHRMITEFSAEEEMLSYGSKLAFIANGFGCRHNESPFQRIKNFKGLM